MSPCRIRHQALLKDTAAWQESIVLLQARCGFTRCLAEVALLRHEGLTEKGVAAELGIPYQTAHARFRRIYREHRVDGAIVLVLLVEHALLTANLMKCAATPRGACGISKTMRLIRCT